MSDIGIAMKMVLYLLKHRKLNHIVFEIYQLSDGEDEGDEMK